MARPDGEHGATEHGATEHGATEHEASAHQATAHEECYACPVGGLFLTARSSSPETFEHLLNAAAELVAAARSVLDGVERVVEQQRAASRDHGAAREQPRVQRIDLAE